MSWLVILLLAIWIYVLSAMRRSDLTMWRFILGSVGLFVFAMVLVEPMVVAPLQRVVSASSGFLGDLTGLYDSYFQQGILFIHNGGESLSLYIDFECSGVIEILAFLALLWFFPVYEFHEKIIVSIIGVFCVYLANVVRIFIICSAIYFGGNEIYFVAHTIIGRLFFYACMVVLYFYIFTRSQIVRQKVGAFHYDRV